MAEPRIRPVMDWLRRVVTQPLDELSRWQKTVRFCYDLGRHGARQLREDRALGIRSGGRRRLTIS